MEEYINQLVIKYKLSEKEITFLRKNIHVHHYPKGTVIIEEGTKNASLYINLEGVIKNCLSGDTGLVTGWFSVKGEMFFSPHTYYYGSPAIYTTVTASECCFLEVSRNTIDLIFEEYPNLSKWIHDLMVRYILETDTITSLLWDKKAEDRYLSIMKKMPEIFQHVPLQEIADFLGITPQSLSRIRAGLVKK